MSTQTENYKYSYPELSEQGQKNTQVIINKFKEELEKVMNDTLYTFTCNLGNEIVDDDSWVNIREQTRHALCGYQTEGNYSSVNWEQVREKIFEENRDVIINDIILDKEKEIAQLKETINSMNAFRY